MPNMTQKHRHKQSSLAQCSCGLVVLLIVIWSMLAQFGGVISSDFTSKWVSEHSSQRKKKDVNEPTHHEQSLPVTCEWSEEETDDNDPKKLHLQGLRAAFKALFTQKNSAVSDLPLATSSAKQNIPIYVLFVCRRTSPSDSYQKC